MNKARKDALAHAIDRLEMELAKEVAGFMPSSDRLMLDHCIDVHEIDKMNSDHLETQEEKEDYENYIGYCKHMRSIEEDRDVDSKVRRRALATAIKELQEMSNND